MDYVNDNIYVVDYLSIFLQHRRPQNEFSHHEIRIMKKAIEENVIPEVNEYAVRWDCRSMWQTVLKSYNVDAKAHQLPSERSMQEVLAIAKLITWCDCNQLRGEVNGCCC